MVRGGFQEKTVFSLNFSFEGNNKKWSGPLLTLCPDIKNYFCLLWSIQQKIAENNIGGKSFRASDESNILESITILITFDLYKKMHIEVEILISIRKNKEYRYIQRKIIKN